MLVITAARRGGRRGIDDVSPVLAAIERRHRSRLVRGPEAMSRTQFRLLTDDPATALTVVLELHRDEQWAIGLGIGTIENVPLPESLRELRGGAVDAAHAAATALGRGAVRVRVRVHGDETLSADIDAVLALLLAHRDRRTESGWELADLLGSGHSRGEAAARLGVSASAVSQRASAAGLVLDAAAEQALARLIAAADPERASASHSSQP